MSVILETVNLVAAVTGEPNPDAFVTNIRNFIAPIFLLAIGLISLSFLMRRQLTAFFQFFLLTVLIGVLFYVPGIVENFATWASGLFFG